MAVANNFPSISIMASEALSHLEDALVIKPLCTTDVTAEYNKTYNGYKVGDSIAFRQNPVYETKTFDERNSSTLAWPRDDSKNISIQNIRTSSRTMYIDKHYDVSVSLSARELAMSFDNFTEMVLKPAAYSLAESVDSFIANKILLGHGLYASTSVLSTQSDMALARKAALEYQMDTDRFCLVDPTLESTLLGSSWFNTTANRSDDAGLTNGFMNRTMGFDFYTSVNFPNTTHLNSSSTATTAASPTGTQNMVGTSSLIVGALASGKAVKAGDRLAIAGCKRPVVASADIAEGETEITLVDPITELIGASSAVTVVGGNAKTLTPRGAIFDSRALGVAMPMLDPAAGEENAVVSSNGISIRVVKGYNMTTKVTTLSMDCLVGATALDPRRITVLANAA